jgi:hypothetical protein
MKIKPTLLGVLLMLCCAVFGQEFRQNTNGLIYSDEAIGKLKYIVDSLNLKFAHCEPRNFYSLVQQRAKTFIVYGDKTFEIKKAIDSGRGFEEVARMVPDSVINRNALAIKVFSKGYKDEPELFFKVYNPDRTDNRLLFVGKEFEKFKNVTQGWVYRYVNDVNDKSVIIAFYIDRPLKSSPLPEKYSDLIQYSECMIDTSSSVFVKNGLDFRLLQYQENKELISFYQLLHKKLKHPFYRKRYIKKSKNSTSTSKVYKPVEYKDSYYKALEEWNKNKQANVKKLFRRDKEFRDKFYEVHDLAKKGVIITDEEFERYVLLFLSAKDVLWLKRNRMVIGGCSVDEAPRKHALAIAELAGETAEWQIFLRAHLDIMNDNFQRVSDGSYAWADRNTYIKELEVIDLNLQDLLIGICLRATNVSDNHYYGSIDRIGRSLSESRDYTVIKQRLIEMIKDDTLDDFNRLMMYYVLENRIYYLTDVEVKRSELRELELVALSMPEHIRPIPLKVE